MVTADASEVLTGPYEVYIDGVSVGHTEGDITAQVGTQTREQLVSKFGESPVDIIHTGYKFTATFTVAQWVLANISALIPRATSSGTSVFIGRQAGTKLSNDSFALKLKSLVAGDDTRNVVMYKAVVTGNGDITLNSEGDKVLEVTVMALVDETRADGKNLGYLCVPRVS